MFSLFLLTSPLLALAAADGYYCGGDRLINPSIDFNEPYYWPENWNETMESAEYALNQTCDWQINLLEGTYATVTFYKDTEMETGINCVYPNGDVDYIADKDLNPYIFTYPQFQVNLRVSDKQGRFSFKVVWSEYPVVCTQNIVLGNEKPFTMIPNECVNVFTAPTTLILAGFTLQDDLYALLRQSAIYDGDSVNATYLGNLATARGNQIVSSSNMLTVNTFGLYKNFNYTLYMAMDKQAAGDVQHFTGANCPSNPASECWVQIPSDSRVSAVATFSKLTEFVEMFFNFPMGATLNIYEGKISADSLLASMNRSNYINQLPLGVKNSLKIYHLDKGYLSFPITRNATAADFGMVFDGRIVKIHSFDFRIYSYNQDTKEVFSTYPTEKLFFNFNVNYCDFNTQTTLTCQVFKDGQVVFSETYTPSNPPPTTNLVAYGDQMSVDYQTNGNYTKGFEITLTTYKNDDVSTLPTSSSVLPSTPTASTNPTRTSTSNPTPASTVTKSISTVSQPGSSTTDTPAPSGSTTMRIVSGSSTEKYETTTKGSGFQRISATLIIFVTVLFVL